MQVGTDIMQLLGEHQQIAVMHITQENHEIVTREAGPTEHVLEVTVSERSGWDTAKEKGAQGHS